ncbi:hypothetical protein ETAA8_07190 [Anatilimnocola aggregata]|uniref:Uncharacterized protein n=1 Tax=Anatilimnocola aggregata TaxID=2528021 RepID=A0A517Y5Y4_9BACT|nr:hypothetical protein ETAA8_07190 [Anatilimnocola aggregata]
MPPSPQCTYNWLPYPRWHGFHPCVPWSYAVTLLANSRGHQFDFAMNCIAALPQNGTKSTRRSHSPSNENCLQTRVEPVPPNAVNPF